MLADSFEDLWGWWEWDAWKVGFQELATHFSVGRAMEDSIDVVEDFNAVWAGFASWVPTDKGSIGLGWRFCETGRFANEGVQLRVEVETTALGIPWLVGFQVEREVRRDIDSAECFVADNTRAYQCSEAVIGLGHHHRQIVAR